VTDRADALFLAAHPDDAEIACGGTILRLVAAGRRVVVVDLTRGEMATRGTPELRAQEAAAATERLGVALRENLGLPDGRLTDDEPSVGTVVEVLRRHRPALLFAPVEADAHPDHAAAARIAGKAFFTAGLRRAHPGTGEAFRPRLLLRYPGNDAVPATFCVATSEFVAGKYSVADMALYPRIAAGAHANVARWASSLSKRPALGRGMSVLAPMSGRPGR